MCAPLSSLARKLDALWCGGREVGACPLATLTLELVCKNDVTYMKTCVDVGKLTHLVRRPVVLETEVQNVVLEIPAGMLLRVVGGVSAEEAEVQRVDGRVLTTMGETLEYVVTTEEGADKFSVCFDVGPPHEHEHEVCGDELRGCALDAQRLVAALHLSTAVKGGERVVSLQAMEHHLSQLDAMLLKLDRLAQGVLAGVEATADFGGSANYIVSECRVPPDTPLLPLVQAQLAREGLCEPAQLSVKNRLDAPVNWQIFAGPCEVDSYGLTEFEGVGDFAAANGMCGAVNRFTYSAIVQHGSPVSEQGRGGETAVATKVSNMDFLRPGPDTEPHSLLQAGVLRAQPHPCDMSYQHTDYKVCTAEHDAHVGAVTDYDDASAASEHDMMWAIRTWQKQDDEESVTFCSIGENSGVEGFLSPYRYYPGDGAAPQNTLRHVADTVLPCSRFQMCPQVNFKVGNFVFARRIMTASGQRGQNTLAFETPVRSYSNRDSDHCFGAGYRISDKGADEAGGDAPGYLERCIVDRWVLPLLSVAFMGDDTSNFLPAYTFCSADTPMFCPAGLRSRFDTLRAQCPRAFGVDAGENSFANFVMHFEKLSRDYAVEEAGSVLAYANSLLPWMFGIEHSQVSYRVFVSVAEYASHVQCATYLIDRMHQISEANPVRNEYMVDGGASKAVGLSLYMFHERAAIHIPFRWFWQCVVTATHTEGGAQADWYLIMTAPDDSHSSILCENYAYQASNAQMTLKRLFQTSEHLFDTAPSYVARDSELENDVVRTTTMALLELKLPSVPNLEIVNFAEDEDNEHDVVMFPTVAEYESSKKLFSKDRTRQLGAVGRITKPIHDDVVQWLFAQESTAYPTTSVSDQILGQHLQERTLDTLVQDTESNIPRYSFARLSATPGLITSLPAVRYYKRNKDFIFDSAGVEQGATAYATRIENGGYQLATAEFGMMLGSPLDAALYPKTLNLAAADDRDSFLQGRVYFTRQQVTYMVLRYLRIHLPFGGYMAGETYGKTDNVRVQAAMNDDTDVSTPFDLSSYKLYNNEMRRKSFECHEFETILYDAETNFAFVQLRQCQLALQKPVGWAVRAGQHLRFSVSKDVMLAGFYCAFSERGSSHLPQLK